MTEEAGDSRTALWDHYASKFSPMQVDAMFEIELQRQTSSETSRFRAIHLRFYLKVVFKVVWLAYNLGKRLYEHAQFELPAEHFHDWKSLSRKQRDDLLGQLRFCHAEGHDVDPKTCSNSFVTACDMYSMSMLGSLDQIFIARHGFGVKADDLKYRAATQDEAIVYLKLAIENDKAAYQIERQREHINTDVRDGLILLAVYNDKLLKRYLAVRDTPAPAEPAQEEQANELKTPE